MRMEEKTTIRVSQCTHDKLASLGSKGETFEDIILKLIELAKKKKRRYRSILKGDRLTDLFLD